jgi:hypothetical protein
MMQVFSVVDAPGFSIGEVGQIGALLLMGWYFLNHLERKDQNLKTLVEEWHRGEDERTTRIEKLGEKFDATVRQFQSDQRTITDQTMALCRSTVQTVTENTNAITALTHRIDGIEKRWSEEAP